MGQQSSAEEFEEPRQISTQVKMSHTPSTPDSYKKRKSTSSNNLLESRRKIHSTPLQNPARIHSTPLQNPAKITENPVPSTSQIEAHSIDDRSEQRKKRKIVEEIIFKCGICNIEFDTKAAAYRHRREIHSDAKQKHFIVKLAKKTQISPERKTRNKSNDKDEQNCRPQYLRRYECQVCEKIFKTNYAKWNHRDDHHPELKNEKIFKKIFVLDNQRSVKPKPTLSHFETQKQKVATKREHVETQDIASKKSKHANQQINKAPMGITPSKTNSGSVQNDVNNTTEHKRHEIYQCVLCNLHFVTLDVVERHIKSCRREIESSSKCKDCELLFYPGELALHQSKGHLTGQYVEFDVIHISRKKVAKKLHHCSQCDVYFTHRRYYDDHVSQNHDKQRVSKCKYCGLIFCKRSFLGHIKYDHIKKKIPPEKPQTTQYSVEAATTVHCDSNPRSDKNIAGTSRAKDSESSTHTHDGGQTAKDSKMPDCEEPNGNKIYLYKCHVCSVHFLKKSSLARHISLEQHNAEIKLPCRYCGLLFPHTIRLKHEKLHHADTVLKDFNILALDQTKTTVSGKDNITATQNTKSGFIVTPNVMNEDKILYRCAICDVHYTMKSSLAKHLKRGNHDVKTKAPCRTCGLMFTAASLTDHIAAHHGKLKIQSTDEFVIKSFGKKQPRKIIDKIVKVNVFRIPNSIIRNEADKISESNLLISQEEKEDGDTSNQRHKHCNESDKTLTQKGEGPETGIDRKVSDSQKHKPDKTDLYKCNVCSVHFLRKSSLDRHISLDQHDAEVKLPCRHCGLLFSQNNYKKHEKLHHVETTTLLKDFKIFTLDQYKNAVVADKGNNVTSQKTKSDLVHIPDNILNEDKILYRCALCDVHYTMKSSLMQHMTQGIHDLKHKAPCKTCGLIFTTASLTDHKAVHHGKLNIESADEFVIKSFGEGPARKILIQNTGHITVTPIPNTIIRHEDQNVVREEKKASNDDKTSSSDEVKGKTEIVHKVAEVQNASVPVVVQNVTLIRNPIRNGIDRENAQVVLPVGSEKCNDDAPSIKPSNAREIERNIVSESEKRDELFKCKHCEVFFLEAISFCKHLFEHYILQPWEYIACPDCGLQFLCADLPDHRQNHKTNEYHPERVIVNEVEINESLNIPYRRYRLKEDTQLYGIVENTVSAETHPKTTSEDESNVAPDSTQEHVLDAANITTIQNNNEANVESYTNIEAVGTTENLKTTHESCVTNKIMVQPASKSEPYNTSENWHAHIEITHVISCKPQNKNISERNSEATIVLKTLNETSEAGGASLLTSSRGNYNESFIAGTNNDFVEKIKDDNANITVKEEAQSTEEIEQTQDRCEDNLNESYNVVNYNMTDSETLSSVENNGKIIESMQIEKETNTETDNEEPYYPLRYTDSTETLHLEPLENNCDDTEIKPNIISDIPEVFREDTVKNDNIKTFIKYESNFKYNEDYETNTSNAVDSVDTGMTLQSPRTPLDPDPYINGNSRKIGCTQNSVCNLRTNEANKHQENDKVIANRVGYSEKPLVLSEVTGCTSGNNEQAKTYDSNLFPNETNDENESYLNSNEFMGAFKKIAMKINIKKSLKLNNVTDSMCSTENEQQNELQNPEFKNTNRTEDMNVAIIYNDSNNNIDRPITITSGFSIMLDNNQEITSVQIKNDLKLDEIEVDKLSNQVKTVESAKRIVPAVVPANDKYDNEHIAHEDFRINNECTNVIDESNFNTLRDSNRESIRPNIKEVNTCANKNMDMSKETSDIVTLEIVDDDDEDDVIFVEEEKTDVIDISDEESEPCSITSVHNIKIENREFGK